MQLWQLRQLCTIYRTKSGQSGQEKQGNCPRTVGPWLDQSINQKRIRVTKVTNVTATVRPLRPSGSVHRSLNNLEVTVSQTK